MLERLALSCREFEVAGPRIDAVGLARQRRMFRVRTAARLSEPCPNAPRVALLTSTEPYPSSPCSVARDEQLLLHRPDTQLRTDRRRTHQPFLKMSSAGTFRGTPKAQRGQTTFSDSPSNIPIPRPKLESTVSDAGSTYSASRAKQSKRDEVRFILRASVQGRGRMTNSLQGHPEQDRERPHQEARRRRRPIPPDAQGTTGYRPSSQAEPSPPD